jgi:hypothetical protein
MWASLSRCWRMRRMVSQPSMPGMPRSMKTRCGAKRGISLQALEAAGRLFDLTKPSGSSTFAACRGRPFVVDHQDAPAHADVADAVAARQLARRPGRMHLRQEEADAEQRALRPACWTCISPPIRSVSMRAMVSPTPLPPACALLPRTKGSKMRSRSAAGMPGPVSRMSKWPFRAGIRPKVTPPRWVNLTALPSTLIRIWRSRFRRRAPRRAVRRPAGSRSQALVARLQFEHATICCRKSGKSSGRRRASACRLRCGRCPACLRSPTAGGRRSCG